MGESQPFSQFGKKLQSLRAQKSRTPAEVCSAVEIDENRLKAYESGESRPSEDILILLINHFGLQDQQAEELWKLAGYRGKPSEEVYFGGNEEQPHIEHFAIGLTIADPRVVYTDAVQILANDFGVIVNFMQGASNTSQPLAVARVGMSKEHAYSVLKLLQKTLYEYEQKASPKQLRSSKGQSSEEKKQ